MADFSLSGGVEVTGFISPTDTADTYPVIDTLYGIDGLRNVDNLTQLNAIPNQRRRSGMLVGVSGGTEYYKLGSSPWSGTSVDWSIFTAGGDIEGTAVVAPGGDDSTGVVGDGNKPFATVTSAQTVSDYIIILPGSYGETITLGDGVNYYSNPGVVFTGGGLSAPVETITNTKWLGHADFISSNYHVIKLSPIRCVNLVIEFNRIIDTSVYSPPQQLGGWQPFTIDGVSGSSSNGNIRGVSISSTCSNGHGVRITGDISGTMTISEYISGDYAPISTAMLSTNFQGVFTINCPRIICPNDGDVGNTGNFKQIVYLGESDADSEFYINGNLYSTVNTIPSPVSQNGGVSAPTGLIASGKFTLNGDISSGKLRSIFKNNGNDITINGNIESDDIGFHIENGRCLIKNSTVITSNTNTLKGTGQLYIENSSLYCSGTSLNIIDHRTLTAKLYITNTTLEGTGTAKCIYTDSMAASAGTINVTSNFSNDAALVSYYTASGFTHEPNLNVPKF
jgi:hypothetical protein